MPPTIWSRLGAAIGLGRREERRSTGFFSSVTTSGYDATAGRGKRKEPTGLLRSEDQELRGAERRKLVSGARDIGRNFSLLGWMIRRHLDYTTTFRFQSKHPSATVNARVERYLKHWSRRHQCDVSGRHSFARMMRLGEARRLLDGDVFFLKLASGGLQAIEGDRIRQWPSEIAFSDTQHGVKVDEVGRPVAYCVCKRTPGAGFQFERWVDAANMVHFGYFDRFDQTRGISPLAGALNSLRDVYEGIDYALARMKVEQLVAMVIQRKDAGPSGNFVTDASKEEGDPDRYEVDFGHGPIKLELDPGDDAKFLAAGAPGAAFESFTQVVIGMTLKALDIPYSFYMENFTNYSGARQAMLQYELSASVKRADVMDVMDEVTEWRLSHLVEDGLPGVSDVRELAWEWVPVGLPWIDPANEVAANIAALGAGLTTRGRILKAQGLDRNEVLQELADEVRFMTGLGLPTGSDEQNATVDKLTDASNQRQQSEAAARPAKGA